MYYTSKYEREYDEFYSSLSDEEKENIKKEKEKVTDQICKFALVGIIGPIMLVAVILMLIDIIF